MAAPSQRTRKRADDIRQAAGLGETDHLGGGEQHAMGYVLRHQSIRPSDVGLVRWLARLSSNASRRHFARLVVRWLK